MSDSNSGQIVIISGPSGSGKSTICQALAHHPKVWISVSATTRPQRSGEEDGVHYFFLDRETFQKWIGEEKFIEYAEFVGNYYGTPLQPILDRVKQGYTCLLDIDIQGQEILREKKVESISIFVRPPNLDVLEERLRNRHTETEETIVQRLEVARKELVRAKELYDHQVINDELDRAVSEVADIIGLATGDEMINPK